jgi:hypothetical protein
MIVVLLFMLGCGGSNTSENIPPPPANYTISISGPDNDIAALNQSVGLVLMAAESAISDINWTQTAGPSTNFLGANRKVIGFDVTETGSYSFQVTFKDSAGGDRNAEYSFTVEESAPVYLNARLDHEANSQAKMSIRAYQSFPDDLAEIAWTQTAGPSVTLDVTNELALFFTAPTVSQDTLLEFQVAATDTLGNQASDKVYILLEPENIDPDSHFSSGRFEGISLADVYAYNRNSPYADALETCIYSNTQTSYCNLSKLPFIGSLNPTPTVDEIMDRVLVSHDWMGARFRTFLEEVDIGDDIKHLLGATTSIVISYDVRPSFFWSGTGAIYMDPFYFWVTPEERDTLNETPDYRSDFGAELSFVGTWRIVKDNEYAFYNPSTTSRENRTTTDSRYYALRVLYHELAHANDFFPPRAWSLASGSDFPFSYSNDNDPDSTQLADDFPLASQEMSELAQVLFQGTSATQAQIDYTPAEVGSFFFPDDATNTYNYSTIREDYAMLAEEYMMGFRHGVLYDQAITEGASEYIVAQGERGRVGHSRITPRAEFVISNILPNVDLQAASASLAAPAQLETGVSWRDSLVIGLKGQESKQKSNRYAPPILTGQDFHLAGELVIDKQKTVQ